VSGGRQSYPIKVKHNRAILMVFLALLSVGAPVCADEFTEEERLLGFAQQQRKNAEADKLRESGVEAVKKRKAEWDQDLAQSVGQYKRWKAEQKAALDENSEEYREDLAAKKRRKKDLEEDRIDYVRERDRDRARRKRTVLLTEEHEYGLDEKTDRAEQRKRALYNPSLLKNFGKSRPGTSGGMDFGGGGVGAPNNPPPDFNPPVSAAPPAAPEFFEPEIPPPPPPVDFDESVPPPIFDDPSDF
jgi:hypothetical protein